MDGINQWAVHKCLAVFVVPKKSLKHQQVAAWRMVGEAVKGKYSQMAAQGGLESGVERRAIKPKGKIMIIALSLA